MTIEITALDRMTFAAVFSPWFRLNDPFWNNPPERPEPSDVPAMDLFYIGERQDA